MIDFTVRSKSPFWVRDNLGTKREQHGEFHPLVQELNLGHHEFLFWYFTSTFSVCVRNILKKIVGFL